MKPIKKVIDITKIPPKKAEAIFNAINMADDKKDPKSASKKKSK